MTAASHITPSVIATLATKDALPDLRNLLSSLVIFNASPPKVYLYCDDDTAAAVTGLRYPGQIVTRTALNKYAGMTRREMEATAGTRLPNLWYEFMAEKINLIQWAFETDIERTDRDGVMFCDADICFFAPLPKIPARSLVALSPHMIRPADEAKFGRYNGGFLWMSDAAFAHAWAEACTSGQRFFEQSALEDLAHMVKKAAPSSGLYEFPKTQNYGWWRLWQGTKSPQELQHEWTMNRMKAPGASGILVEGEPLGSVHTHFTETVDQATAVFNQWVLQWLQRLQGGHAPARRLLTVLTRPH